MVELTKFKTSPWLDAAWDPSIRVHALSNAIEMLDLNGDGDFRLVIADLGENVSEVTKLKVFKGADQVTELTVSDISCAIVGFYTESGVKESSVLAVGAGCGLFIYKNIKPYFKYCLPQLNLHSTEKDIWYKAGLSEEANVLTLMDDVKSILSKIGATNLSSRSLKLLALDAKNRHEFVEQYRRVPLVKHDVVTVAGVIRKDSWNDMACSYLIIGTEFGDVLILDNRAFFVVDKFNVGWTAVALTSSGMWTGDGQIVVVGREGNIGALKRGSAFMPWEKLSVPVVAIASMTCEGVAVATMNANLIAFSKKGFKLWKVNLSGNPLDMVSLPIVQTGLSLLAVSLAGLGIRIYDQKYHIDTIKSLDSVSALKFGRLGQEERTLALVTCNGGLNIKILRRTADFNVISNQQLTLKTSKLNARFVIPKKTKLFLEQTLRERSEAVKIHTCFQQCFLRIRLDVANKIEESLTKTRNAFKIVAITVQSLVLGFGPQYIVKILITNMSKRYVNNNLFLICREKNAIIKPRLLNLPFLDSGLTLPVTLTVVPKTNILSDTKILLCSEDNIDPLIAINVVFPMTEEDIKV